MWRTHSCVPRRHSCRRLVLTSLRLSRLEANLPQYSSVRGKILLPRRKPVGLQQKRKNIGVLLPAQRSRAIGRHRRLHLLEQIVGGLSVPIGLEVGARKWRHGPIAIQSSAVARRALLGIGHLSAVGLRLGINTVPHRSRRLRENASRHNQNEPDCDSHSAYHLRQLPPACRLLTASSSIQYSVVDIRQSLDARAYGRILPYETLE